MPHATPSLLTHYPDTSHASPLPRFVPVFSWPYSMPKSVFAHAHPIVSHSYVNHTSVFARVPFEFTPTWANIQYKHSIHVSICAMLKPPCALTHSLCKHTPTVHTQPMMAHSLCHAHPGLACVCIIACHTAAQVTQPASACTY